MGEWETWISPLPAQRSGEPLAKAGPLRRRRRSRSDWIGARKRARSNGTVGAPTGSGECSDRIWLVGLAGHSIHAMQAQRAARAGDHGMQLAAPAIVDVVPG